MNSAERLNRLLEESKITPSKTAISVFEKLFDVEGTIAVSSKLRMCHMQINKLKKGGAHENLIKYLENFFSDKNLCRDTTGLLNQKVHHVSALHTTAAFMAKEEKNEKELTELADLIQQMKDKIHKSSISEESKEFLYAYTDEIMEGIVDIHIGGVEGYKDHLIKATGIYVIHHEVFEEGKLIQDVSQIFNLSAKILDNSGIASKFLGYMTKNLLDNKE